MQYCRCMKHRSKIIEPGTYGTNPNAIACMTAFIGDASKKTYNSIQETGQKTLKTISSMPSDIMPTKSQGGGFVDKLKPGEADKPCGAAQGIDGKERGRFSRMVCYKILLRF